MNHKTILILSPEDWGINQLSKHLYANELSKTNNVYFLHTTPHPSQTNFIETSLIHNNITLIHLRNVVKGIFKLPPFLIDAQNKLIIKKIKKTITDSIDVVWSFDQSKFQNLAQFNAPLAIFHPVDYIIKATPFVNRIADSANLVLSVSPEILATINTNTPKHFINHGLDEIFLQKQEQQTIPSFIILDKINVGYVGNLQMKLIDYENLIQTVRENSTFNFVFIGPDKASNLGGKAAFTELDTLKSLQNTHFTGELTKITIAKYLPFFDIFWLCYNHKEFPIEVSNSHKILEYLSTGKVIISNFFAYYKAHKNLLVMTDENEMLSQLFSESEQQLETYNAIENQQERISFAKENTYKKQLERIEMIINNLYE